MKFGIAPAWVRKALNRPHAVHRADKSLSCAGLYKKSPAPMRWLTRISSYRSPKNAPVSKYGQCFICANTGAHFRGEASRHFNAACVRSGRSPDRQRGASH